MSEYEKINFKVKAQVSARRKDAIKKIVLVFGLVLASLGAIVGLEVIGFISITFAIILAAIAVIGGAFKTGYIWRDIKI